jgi:hypothetical protein
MIDAWWIGKDLEGTGSGLIEVLSRYFIWGTEENPVRAEGVPTEVQTEHFSNKSVKRYRYANTGLYRLG